MSVSSAENNVTARPKGFRNTIQEKDVRRAASAGAAGLRSRLGPLFHATVTFDAEGDKTRVTVRMILETPEQLKNVVEQFGALEGLNQTLGRLGEQLAKVRTSAVRELVITRVFDAPREIVFKAWTDSSQLWGPHSFTNPVCDA